MPSSERITAKVYGPVEARARWEIDDQPYDPGDCNDAETWAYVEQFGVFGCIVETRGPACPCCGAEPQWEHAQSLWSIVGDADYHREIERELFAEVAS